MEKFRKNVQNISLDPIIYRPSSLWAIFLVSIEALAMKIFEMPLTDLIFLTLSLSFNGPLSVLILGPVSLLLCQLLNDFVAKVS